MQTFKTTSILLFSFFVSFNSTSFSKEMEILNSTFSFFPEPVLVTFHDDFRDGRNKQY